MPNLTKMVEKLQRFRPLITVDAISTTNCCLLIDFKGDICLPLAHLVTFESIYFEFDFCYLVSFFKLKIVSF